MNKNEKEVSDWLHSLILNQWILITLILVLTFLWYTLMQFLMAPVWLTISGLILLLQASTYTYIILENRTLNKGSEESNNASKRT